MISVRNIALAYLCASVWTTPPAYALCIESGEYEQAIADMEVREGARTKAEATQAQTGPILPAESQAAEIAAAGDTMSGAN